MKMCIATKHMESFRRDVRVLVRHTFLPYNEILEFLGVFYRNHHARLHQQLQASGSRHADALIRVCQQEVEYVHEACSDALYHQPTDREHGEPLDLYVETYFELRRAGWRPRIRWSV
jgi:hypothetical protein